MRYKAEYKPSDVLCPVRGVWVNFEVAKKKLETRSPIRHCCDFSTPDQDEKGVKEEDEDEDDHKKEQSKYFSSNGTYSNAIEASLDYVRLSLTPGGTLITVNMLTSEGQDILRPILREFVLETGFDVARRCVIKLFS